MLVYGDPSDRLSFRDMRDRLRARAESLARDFDAGSASLDLLRSFLIQAGQWEQANADDVPALIHEPNEAAARIAEAAAITDAAAAIFCYQWKRSHGASEAVPIRETVGRFASLMALPGWTSPLPEGDVRVKLPEGFAFYVLFPEQYCAAAEQWLAQHAGASKRQAIVVGVRSIGTTLSAVVAATVAAHGWQVERRTVRPTGHPFARRASLAPLHVSGDVHALVVDEGPGISGSSMVAAARALLEAGVARARIAFFPGHDGAPGNAANDEVREWWNTTARHVVPLEQMRWSGRFLTETLADATSQLMGGAVARIEDLRAGNWRRTAYASEREWPAVCAAFERTKYRCLLKDGRSVLWKFAGLAGESRENVDPVQLATDRQSRLAKLGWTTEPLGDALGFVGTLWVQGRPLTRTDRYPVLLEKVGRYVADCAGPAMDPQDSRAAFNRISEMLIHNVREEFRDERLAQSAAALAERAWREMEGLAFPTYGDGHLAPHEWLLIDAERIVKADAGGHEFDHTLVGRQPAFWDLAAAMVEWDCDEACAEALFRGASPLKWPTTPEVTGFYRIAYAAFRMGQCRLCADLCAGDTKERARLAAAANSYRSNLLRALTSA